MKTLLLIVFPLFLFFQQESSCQKEKQTNQATSVAEKQASTDAEQFENIKLEQQDETINKESLSVSDCMQAKIEFFKKERSFLQTSQIFTFTSKGETFYFFDEGMALDAPAYILNENCDTVCVTGGMRRGQSLEERAKCPKQDEGSRQTIWKKGA